MDHCQHQQADCHSGHGAEPYLKKFLISAALTLPVLIYSDLPVQLLSWQAPAFPGSQFLALALGSIVFFYGGWVFLAGALRELKAGQPGMMTLIGLAVTAAYLYSAGAILTGGEHTLFWELTTLISVMLLGHWFEMKAVQGTQSALNELAKLLPDTAEVIRGTQTLVLPIAQLAGGDIILVRPGGRVPADGVVTEGASDVDESMVTGESRPVAKSPNSQVIAGTINGDGALKVRVVNMGERTFLAGVMRLVADAQASKSRLQMLSDRAAFYLTLVAITTGALTFAAWLLANAGFPFALERLVAVLVITCPHALGLAIPLVASISTALAARHGFLVRQRLALEQARAVDIVLFDKTGTLTKGEYGVTKIIQNAKYKNQNKGKIFESEILQLAASVDSQSEHFAARAIVKAAEAKGLKLLEVNNFQRVAGKGVRGVVAGDLISVGGAAIVEELGATAPETLAWAGQGETLIYVVREHEVLGVIALADIIREESRQAIQALKSMGIKVAMVTGDAEDVAQWVAKDLSIEQYFARVLPAEKAEKVKLLQVQGLKVAMVGDGINDAPALTQADLGIAIGAGTNVAIESAGIILIKSDPRDIPKVIKLSRATYRKMLQNLFWATGYNVAALPLAAGALATYGIVLEPAVSAVLMSLSTIIVAFNALLLKRQAL